MSEPNEKPILTPHSLFMWMTDRLFYRCGLCGDLASHEVTASLWAEGRPYRSWDIEFRCEAHKDMAHPQHLEIARHGAAVCVFERHDAVFVRQAHTALKASHSSILELYEWVIGEDSGRSSITIWNVLSGLRAPEDYRPDAPYDDSDFGCCYRLVHQFGWQNRLHEVSEKYPYWKPIVDAWDELSLLYQLGDGAGIARRIDEIRDSYRKRQKGGM